MIIYASKGNSAKLVAERIYDNLNSETPIVNLYSHFRLVDQMINKLIFVSPTYGDEELEEKVEDFLINSNWLKYKKLSFYVCELGLYRGYVEPHFGSGNIIIKYLNAKELEFKPPLLSVDSMPLNDFSLIDQWCTKII
jgi:flavodoxin